MKKLIHSVIVAIGLLGLGSTVQAAQQDAPSSIGPKTLKAFGAPVSDHALSTYRGGHLLQISKAELSAELNNNNAFFTTSGSNTISGNAFRGASGIPTVVQNSGNNVIIQSATVLNVQVH